MSRLAALVRAWLDVPSRAEVMPKIRETRVVVTALASERAAFFDPEARSGAIAEASRHADKVCCRYMACQPLEDERPLLREEHDGGATSYVYGERPAAVPALSRGDRLVLGFFYGGMALALLAALALWGCTIRGGADCTGGCPPAEVCAGERCRPAADLRPVPAPGGPL